MSASEVPGPQPERGGPGSTTGTAPRGGKPAADLPLAPGDDLAVSVRALRKAYGSFVAVHDVSFTVARGEIVGLLGPNGSGKTTTVECLEGLRRADSGRLEVLGFDPRTQAEQLRRRIGCQLQDAALPARLRVGEAVRLFAAVAGCRVDVGEVLGDWGLADKQKSAFGALSGGQRQRLFVALALLHHPELVFLDEMTTGLDPAARRETWRLVERVRELGAAIVLVTHFMDEAERLCDRLVVVRAGRVVASGTPAELARLHGGGVTASFSTDLPDARLLSLPGIGRIRRKGRSVTVDATPQALLHLGHLLVDLDCVPDDLTVRQATLEDAYLALVADGTPPTDGAAA